MAQGCARWARAGALRHPSAAPLPASVLVATWFIDTALAALVCRPLPHGRAVSRRRRLEPVGLDSSALDQSGTVGNGDSIRLDAPSRVGDRQSRRVPAMHSMIRRAGDDDGTKQRREPLGFEAADRAGAVKAVGQRACADEVACGLCHHGSEASREQEGTVEARDPARPAGAGRPVVSHGAAARLRGACPRAGATRTAVARR